MEGEKAVWDGSKAVGAFPTVCSAGQLSYMKSRGREEREGKIYY